MAEQIVTDAELDEVERILGLVPSARWYRDVYEDGESGEGPFGVHPGSPGPMVQGNDILTAEEDPEEICHCENGQIADFVVLAHETMPRLVAELRRYREPVGINRAIELSLIKLPDHLRSANVAVMLRPHVEQQAKLARENAALRAEVEVQKTRAAAFDAAGRHACAEIERLKTEIRDLRTCDRADLL